MYILILIFGGMGLEINCVELIMNNWKCIQCLVDPFIFLWIKIFLWNIFFISFLAFFFLNFFNRCVFLLCILNFSLRSIQIINRTLALKTFLMLNITITIQILDLSYCKEDLRGRVSSWSFRSRIQWWATGCKEKLSSSLCGRWTRWILMIVKCQGSINIW